MIEPPKDTPEYAHGAWASALFAASREPKILKAFQDETGMVLSAAKTPIDMMIDEATGRNEKIAHAFGDWFNRNVWGPWEGEAIHE